jgi:hypothetical protein
MREKKRNNVSIMKNHQYQHIGLKWKKMSSNEREN